MKLCRCLVHEELTSVTTKKKQYDRLWQKFLKTHFNDSNLKAMKKELWKQMKAWPWLLLAKDAQLDGAELGRRLMHCAGQGALCCTLKDTW